MSFLRRPTSAPRPGPATGERGAIAVEFAVAASLLVFLFFSVLEMGVLLRTRSVITDASREGTRVAAAQPRVENWQDQSIAAINGVAQSQTNNPIDYVVIYRADPSTGDHFLGENLETCTTSCWRYEWKNGGFEEKLGATWEWDDISACGGVLDTDWVAVYIRGHHDWVTGLLGTSRVYTDTTVMRFEPMGTNQQCRPVGP